MPYTALEEALDPTKPNMGDPAYVDGQVREMLTEVNDLLFSKDQSRNPQGEIPAIVDKWAAHFRADNPALVQTMTIEAQDAWLKQHGIGTDDTVPGEPVKALVAQTISRFADAAMKHYYEQINDDQLEFALDTIVEDATALLLGIENPAD